MMQRNDPKIPRFQPKSVIFVLKSWVSRWRAQMAVRAIRAQAHKNGLDKITGQEIDTLIKKTREDQKH